MAFTKDRVTQYSRPIVGENPFRQPRGPFKPDRNLAAEWPEVFQLRTTNRLPSGKWDKGPAETEAIIFCDPRPDLGGEDEKYWWFWLLANAWEVNKELAITLHGFRCQGCKLEPNSSGGMKIVPEVSERGWESVEDYQMARDKYLVPHQKQLVKLLKNLH